MKTKVTYKRDRKAISTEAHILLGQLMTVDNQLVKGKIILRVMKLLEEMI